MARARLRRDKEKSIVATIRVDSWLMSPTFRRLILSCGSKGWLRVERPRQKTPNAQHRKMPATTESTVIRPPLQKDRPDADERSVSTHCDSQSQCPAALVRLACSRSRTPAVKLAPANASAGCGCRRECRIRPALRQGWECRV